MHDYQKYMQGQGGDLANKFESSLRNPAWEHLLGILNTFCNVFLLLFCSLLRFEAVGFWFRAAMACGCSLS